MAHRLPIMKTILLFLASCVGVAQLVSCAAGKRQTAVQGSDFETWCAQSRLERADVKGEAEAKASEVKVTKLRAQLGEGLSVNILLGTKIKDGSAYSTTSFYELQDSKGNSMVRFPSRLSLHGFEGNYRLWASADRSLIPIYEWIETGVDSHEMHFVFQKDEGRWSARSIKIPKFRGSFPGAETNDPRDAPGSTGPYGPDVMGVAGHSLIVIPRRGVCRRAQAEDLELDHPFPFIVG